MKEINRSIIWLALFSGLFLSSIPTALAVNIDGATAGEAQTQIAGGGLHPIDWAVIALYMLGMLSIGLYYALRTNDSDDYLLGGRQMKSSAVGLSLFATLLSTISYLAMPGEMINKGPVILFNLLALPIAYVVAGWFLIPHFMKLRMTSAYEILETRLGLKVRLLASTIFLSTRLLWMALIMYVTADKVLVPMLGWDPKWTPLVAAIIGLITVVYTSMGGLRAVVVTDVIQSFILLGGAILSIIMISHAMGGVQAWWPTEWSPSWDDQPLFSWDLHVRATVVGSIVYMTVWWICTAGSDQLAIQRYLATRDVKTARQVFMVTGIANVVVSFCLACLGFALLGFFQLHPEYLEAAKLTMANDGDKIFPFYIIKFLPIGITGLVISGLLAAAMSSLSAGINSSCSVISADFFDRFVKKDVTEKARVRRTRIISVVSGLITVALSTTMGKVTGNIMEVTVRTNHIFVAPLFALFFMALFVPFAEPFGTAIGALAGCVIAIVIAYWDLFTGNEPLSFQWVSLISLIVNLGISIPLCWVLSGFGKCRKSVDY